MLNHLATCQVLLWKPIFLYRYSFIWKKNRLNTYLLTSTIIFLRFLKNLEEQQIKFMFLTEPLIVLKFCLCPCSFLWFSRVLFMLMYLVCLSVNSVWKVVLFRKDSLICQPVYWILKIIWLQMTFSPLFAENDFTKYDS